jgi:hypothetical protein
MMGFPARCHQFAALEAFGCTIAAQREPLTAMMNNLFRVTRPALPAVPPPVL